MYRGFSGFAAKTSIHLFLVRSSVMSSGAKRSRDISLLCSCAASYALWCPVRGADGDGMLPNMARTSVPAEKYITGAASPLQLYSSSCNARHPEPKARDLLATDRSLSVSKGAAVVFTHPLPPPAGEIRAICPGG